MRRLLVPVLVVFWVLQPGAPALPSQDGPIEIVSVAATEANLKALAEMGADVLKGAAGRIYIVATAGDLGGLSTRGIPFAVETARFAPARPVATSGRRGASTGNSIPIGSSRPTSRPSRPPIPGPSSSERSERASRGGIFTP